MIRGFQKIFSIMFILLFVVTLMSMQIVRVSAISPNIVISQVYGGGGNSGATLTNDFIELFNRGETAVDITGWSVQYASSTGSTWQVTTLSGTVQPGQYYLVQEAAGSGGTTPLPAPDAVGTIAMSATSGKVALVNTSTALSGATPEDPSIVDVVGYGLANFYEGSAAPALSNTTAAFRAVNGCTDTDDNSTDFSTGTPNPRNAASPINQCGGGDTAPLVYSTIPSENAAGVALSANIDITFNEPVYTSTNWFDITCTGSGNHTAVAIGGSTTFTLDPDIDFNYSESCTVTVYAAQVADQDTNDPPDTMDADFVFVFYTEGEPVEQPDIIITEIMYDPNSSEDNWEWIEIYNAGTETVDLTGFVIDDFNSMVHPSANINSGVLAAGEQAVLYNVDDVSPVDFLAAWGTVNLIPVTNWSAMALNNGGDKISLWQSFADYVGDHVNHANAIDTVYYGSGFPDPVGSSIFLNDLAADNNVGANWSVSSVGGVTPLYTGYSSKANGGNLGTDVGSPGIPLVLINEVDSDTPSYDILEFIELYDGGTGNTPLDGLVLVLFNGNGDISYAPIFDLDGYATNADGYFVIGSITGSDIYVDPGSSGWLQNGADAVALYAGDAADFPIGTAVTTTNLVDALVYDTADPDDTGLLILLNAGQPQVNEDGLNNKDNQSNQRCPNGEGGERNTTTYTQYTPTPGASNCEEPPPPPEICGDPVTHMIYEIQGSGMTSPIVGTEVAFEGVVVGDFQNNGMSDNGDLNGFYVQDPQGDGDSATSDGIFVYAPGGIDVSNGDRVRVRGFVSEYVTSSGLSSMTEIKDVALLLECDITEVPAPEEVVLPVIQVTDFERYEGMLVSFPQNLYIAEYFNFDRYNEIVLSTNRQFQPTVVYEPGSPEAASLALSNSLNRITLDDGRSTENPDPAIHPDGQVFDLNHLFRGGDRVQAVTGLIDETFGLYRIHPILPGIYTAENFRTLQPEDTGGYLKVASFNVLNYFTTIDTGAPICGPLQDQECRGADDANEFTRQRDKIISALVAINADVVGLIEIENYPGDVPTADLVDGLNAVMGAGTYDYVATGAIGTDAIRVAMIYKPGFVSLQGNFAVLDDQSFTNPLGYVDQDGNLVEKSRPALAQTYMDNATGGVFTTVVNHLKSKGSECGPGDDDPEQGSCNLTRTLGAQALVDWLETDPTGSGDADFLIIGDLNAYDKEDPIDSLVTGGYTDLVHQYQGEYAYSYVFDGQLGYLDHALAGPGLLDEVTGVTVWHINADEPDLLDYDTTFKQPNQDAIYMPDPFRSSDHDPVIIGLTVCDEIAPVFDHISVSPDNLWPVNHKYVDVTATVVVSDNFDLNPIITLVSVVSNEPDDGLGDGDTPQDIVIVDAFHFKLRAERAGGGSGRIYTITYKVTDSCGNETFATAMVFVPLNQGT